MPSPRFEIHPRPPQLGGGGWLFRLLAQQPDGEEIEVGGGVFPPEPEKGISADDAYADALEEGQDWLASLPEMEEA